MNKILIFSFAILTFLSSFSQNNLVDANNEFAIKFYKASIPDSANFFISPFSINIALSIANEGARSSTREEMDKLLCTSAIENIAESYNDFITMVTNLKDPACKENLKWLRYSEGNNLYLANSIWANSSLEVNEDYKVNIAEQYVSEIFEFESTQMPVANERLLRWVSEKTNGKIQKISRLRSDIQLSIINAIYFKGEWKSPFDEKRTKTKKFHTINREKAAVSFMRKTNYYEYFEDKKIKTILIPYQCNQLSLLVMLPHERYGISKIEKNLDLAYLQRVLQSGSTREVVLSLPKIEIETELYAKDRIMEMGYGEMFCDQADFSGMSQSKSLKIGEIIHKTVIKINEQKTEAAALTKVDVVLTGLGQGGMNSSKPPPKIFNANHPFLFAIIDNRTGAIVFMGRQVHE